MGGYTVNTSIQAVKRSEHAVLYMHADVHKTDNTWLAFAETEQATEQQNASQVSASRLI